MMKKIFIAILMAALQSPLSAQEQKPQTQRELGLVFTGLNSFGLTYRQGNQNALWRYRVMTVDGGVYQANADSLNSNSSQFGLSLLVGREYRSSLDEKFTLRYGLDVGVGLSFAENTNKIIYPSFTNESYSRTNLYMASLNLVCGVNYQLNDKIILGMEVLPQVMYRFGDQVNRLKSSFGTQERELDISDWNYRLSLSSVLLSAVYVF